MLKSRRGPVLAVAGKTYTVKPGDSVYAIAVKYKVCGSQPPTIPPSRLPARRAPRCPPESFSDGALTL
jgi:hypothetical protein